uniref:Uncharacterized protein n=1 Tax=Trichogramma kaykai TaxID=54128 RepID=A0ABD2WWL2_9HYME
MEAGARRSHLLPHHQLAGLLAKACAVTAAAAATAAAAETAALSLPACLHPPQLPIHCQTFFLLAIAAKYICSSNVIYAPVNTNIKKVCTVLKVKKFTKISRGLSARRASNENKRKRREQKSFLNLFGNALKKYLVRTQCTPLETREFFSSSCCCLQDPSLPRSVVVV